MYEQHKIILGEDTIVMHRFKGSGVPVLLLHGSVENGKIFFTKQGKGLAPWLAQNGFDVFIPDMRGKGESTPKIAKGHSHTQYEQITEDIPAYLNFIKVTCGQSDIHFGAHSWGGVLLLSFLARFNNTNVKSMVFFGTKRKIYKTGLKKWFMIDLMWNKVGTFLSNKYGYLPSVKLKFGSDNEPKDFYQQTNQWVMNDNWIDPVDGYDYKKNLQKLKLPPTLFLTGTKDKMLGFKGDVIALKNELGDQQMTDFKHIGKAEDFKNDYDHINLLTHPDCPEDVFPLMLDWLNSNS